MNKTIITVGSVTYAIKLRKLLAREGIESELVKISANDFGGCTHGVKINKANYFNAVGILREKGIEYSVYCSTFSIEFLGTKTVSAVKSCEEISHSGAE